MIEKIKNWVDKLTTLIRTNKKAFTVTAATFFAVVAVTILVCTAVLNERAETNESERGFQWGDGITEGVPSFSGTADNIESSKEFAAAYYSNVKGEDVEDYIKLVSKECGVEFQGRQYPLTASFGDRIIAVHYNVTEMRFSVTVAQTN